MAEPPEPDATVPRSGRRAWPAWALDAALAILVGLAVLAVHDVGYMLNHPFWLDEAWVADSTRAPFGLLPWVTSSTPFGWTLLLRLVPFGGEQGLRLVPLVFAGLTGVAGYLFGRELRLTRYVTGLLTGAAALLAPAMLVRDDLKQYTAEAFASVVLLYLVARIENAWSRRTLVTIALVTGLGLFFANTVVFVGVAAMAGLGLECLVRKQFRRLAEVAVASAGMLALSAAVYAAIDLPHQISSLTAYWDGYYVPRNQGLSGAFHFIHAELAQLAPYFGFRSLRLDAVLALAGVVSLIWLKRYALAVTIPLTVVLLIGASAARKYPFGDLRTSTFWIVMVSILMAVAVATVIHLVQSINRPLALIGAAAALGVWVSAAHPYIRSHSLSVEDVRSQVAYLDQHRRPGDVVILSYSASYGFAYYETELTPSFKHIDYAAVGFLPVYPHVPWLVQMQNRNASDVTSALARATALVAAEGGRGRIWIIRSHLEPTEATAWSQDLTGKQVTVIHTGSEPLLLYQPS